MRVAQDIDAEAKAASAGDLPGLTLEVTASFTADTIVPGLQFWLRELGLQGQITLAPYGQILQTLLSPVPRGEGRRATVVLLRVRDWLRELSADNAADLEYLRSYLHSTARDFERAVRTHRSQAGGETLLVLCPAAGAAGAIEESLLQETETRLRSALTGVPGLRLVDARAFHELYGIADSDVADPLRDRIAHVPYREAYFHALATITMRALHHLLSPVRKVVVVDCDNTLWRGVVGEVDAEGVAFEPVHQQLHQTLTRLAQSGTLVCLCSKNEEADVWRVFESRPELGLRREHVVAAAINWRPKSENLRSLAARLNLGLDSFVFLDDNDVECAEVRSACPEVLTLHWPAGDPERASRLLRHTWELDGLAATAEDRRRTELYLEEFRRQELRSETLTFRDFIASLGLRVAVEPLSDATLSRAAQLTLRTNQFNFTTRRRDEAELRALDTGGRHLVRTVRVSDRFGDYGLVGLLIAESDGDLLNVDTFLLSCRVLGRGVEHEMAAELGRLALNRGAAAVRLRVEPTKRNTPARTFLQSISPSDLEADAAGVLQCDLPAEYLVEMRFDPPDESTPAAAASVDSTPAVMAVDATRVRARERQIDRTAYELSSVQMLTLAVAGRGSTPSLTAPPQGRPPEAIVYETFAAVLGVPVDQIQQIDRLDALGCDSLKIVEITVRLSQSFPSLPATLLFEHRSVSAIARHIGEIVSHPGSAGVSTGAAPALCLPSSGGPRTTEIAVVGLDVRCAGASSPQELWDLLSEGRVAVRRVPADRPYFLRRGAGAEAHWAGLLDDVDAFDAELFGISPREAESMDPQLRLFLQVAWTALEDAGALGRGHEPDTGVFVGVMYGDYGRHVNALARTDNPYRCWEGFSLANRLSQVLGFRGPSFAVDTACSSSGTALHLACQALAAGDCRMAVVGGVNLILDPERFTQLARLGILSPSGRCLAFGAEADGTVLGEGVGVVVLRPLGDALRRGERIYGVIKGTGLSTGSGTVGFTAPNPQAQAEAIRRSLRMANIDPRTVTYVETHGTGTGLGDPIEVRGLTLGYGSPDLAPAEVVGAHRCRLGSIKPNIGHLEAGAGVLGFIKVLLQLDRGTLLPSISSQELNPQIPFADTPFTLQRSVEPWERLDVELGGAVVPVPRRAGVSSFGVGGANAHIIVEEPPGATRRSPDERRPLHLLAVSGSSEEALHERLHGFRQLLETDMTVRLPDVCFSANVGRRHLERRVALVASDPAGMAAALARRASERRTQPPSARSRTSPKVAFLFTGQGAQYPGMGRQLYETQPVFREALDRCAAVLDGLLPRPLLQVVLAPPAVSEAELLDQTGYTQPALFAIEYALAALWQSWGIRPDFVLGHSVGEIAAMCVAGGLPLEDAAALIAARGRLMQALPPGGAMVALMTSEARVLRAIGERDAEVAIAAVNGPHHVVISGSEEAVLAVAANLESEGVRGKRLTVSHAFHSPAMRAIVSDYAAVVRTLRFSAPAVPIVSGVHGGLAGEEVTAPEYWIRNVLDPVRFADGIATLEACGPAACLEIGPQPVLIGMARQFVAKDGRLWLPSVRRDVDDWQTMLTSLGRLYEAGADVDWQAFDAPYFRRRVSLPAYPFARKRYWTRAEAAVGPPASAPAAAPVQAPGRPPAECYDLVWQRQDWTRGSTDGMAGHWVVLADGTGVGAALADMLEQRGAHCSVVVPEGGSVERRAGYRVDPASREDWEKVLREVSAGPSPPSGIVYMWGVDAPPSGDCDAADMGRQVGRALQALVRCVQALVEKRTALPIWIVTRGVAAIPPFDDPPALTQAPFWGLGRSLALEHPEAWGGIIDLDPRTDTVSQARDILDALIARDIDDQLAFRGGERHVLRLVPRPLAGAGRVALDGTGTYLITGGLGALGRRTAEWLVSRGARHLVLTSRTGPDSPGAEDVVRSLQDLGAHVTVARADVTVRQDVERLLQHIQAGAAPLRGLVHAAGTEEVLPLARLTPEVLESVLAPKVTGAWLLHELTQSLPLDLFVSFSSVASVLGATGRAHYAAANAFLDSLAAYRRASGLPALTINWGPWKGAGMAAGPTLAEFERIGNHGLDPDEAIRFLEAALLSEVPQVSVAAIDWKRFLPIYEARRVRPVTAGLRPHSHPPDRSLASPAAPWRDMLRQLPPERRHAELTTLLRSEAARTLGFADPAELPVDRNLFESGLDSLAAADLAQRLNGALGVRDAALVFDHPVLTALSERLLQDLDLSAEPGGPAPGHADSASWLRLLHQTASPERTHVLADLLRQELAATLGFGDTTEVAVDRPFPEMGMDSLAAAEFAERLGSRLGIRRVGLVFDHPTVAALAAHLIRELDGAASPAEGGVADHRSPAQVAGQNGHLLAHYDELLEFQAVAFPTRRRDLIPPRLHWMFVASAERLNVQPRVWVHRDGGRVVGQNGAIPVRLQVGRQEMLTAWLVETMVLEEYRDRAVGTRLMMEAHAELPFALSLGQTVQMREIQFRLGWVQVAPLQTAQLMLNPDRVLDGKLPRPAARAAGWGLRVARAVRGALREPTRGTVREVPRFDPAHDRLWDAVSADIVCGVRRDASYLNWKYVDQPGQDFVRLELADEGGVRGVAVCMFRDADESYRYRRAYLVDIVAPLSDSRVLGGLVQAVIRVAADRVADSLVCLHTHAALTNALRSHGFHIRRPGRVLLVRPGPIDADLRRQVLAGENWFLTHGDSDIDRPW